MPTRPLATSSGRRDTKPAEPVLSPTTSRGAYGTDWHERAARWLGDSGDGSGSDPESGPDAESDAEADRSVDLAQSSDLGWVRAIEVGLPTEALEAVLDQGVLSWEDVQELVIPRRTFSHRKERSGRLSPEESDRLVLVLRTLAQAEEVFGAEEKARRWLRKPNRALGGSIPFRLLKTSNGARLVDEILGRIAHGVFS